MRDCIATQYFRFAVGRTETEEDRCSVDHSLKSFAEHTGDLRALMVAIAKSDAFRYRQAP